MKNKLTSGAFAFNQHPSELLNIKLTAKLLPNKAESTTFEFQNINWLSIDIKNNAISLLNEPNIMIAYDSIRATYEGLDINEQIALYSRLSENIRCEDGLPKEIPPLTGPGLFRSDDDDKAIPNGGEDLLQKLVSHIKITGNATQIVYHPFSIHDHRVTIGKVNITIKEGAYPTPRMKLGNGLSIVDVIVEVKDSFDIHHLLNHLSKQLNLPIVRGAGKQTR